MSCNSYVEVNKNIWKSRGLIHLYCVNVIFSLIFNTHSARIFEFQKKNYARYYFLPINYYSWCIILYFYPFHHWVVNSMNYLFSFYKSALRTCAILRECFFVIFFIVFKMVTPSQLVVICNEPKQNRDATYRWMLAHNLRRWPNIKPTLKSRLVFSDKHVLYNHPPFITWYYTS